MSVYLGELGRTVNKGVQNTIEETGPEQMNTSFTELVMKERRVTEV